MKKIFILSLSFLMLFTIYLPNTGFAKEKENVIMTVDEENKLKSEFTKLGVNIDVQEKLIKKLKNGELIDSINPEMKDKAIVEEKVEKDKNDNIIKWETKKTYPDGSVSVQTVTPVWIYKGTGYTSFQYALVEENSVVWDASFRADFTLVNGGYDYISRVYESLIQINFGTYNLQYFGVDKPSETYSHPANARQQFDYTVLNGAVTHTVIVYLVVGNDYYYSDVVSTE